MKASGENQKNATSVDEYLATCPDELREVLDKLRNTIQNAAPDAAEMISYQMPAYKLNGWLVYFAANKKHIGFYPAPSGVEHFREELAGYKFSKGAIQFPLGEPVPFDLVERIVRFRVAENLSKKIK